METNPTIDLRNTLRKPTNFVRAEEALRAHWAGAIAAERARLDRDRVKQAPAPTPRCSKARTPSLTRALREAKKGGISVAGATFTADGSVSLSFGDAVTNGNELDEWMARHANATKRN
jgi:hypothetical protein